MSSSGNSEDNSPMPGLKSCVLCHRNNDNCEGDLQNWDNDGANVEECEIFLENVLLFSKKTIQEISKEFGGLQRLHIPLCNVCLKVVKEGSQIKEQIAELERQFSVCQMLILDTIKETYNCRGIEMVQRNVQEFLMSQMRQGFHSKTFPAEKRSKLCNNGLNFKLEQPESESEDDEEDADKDESIMEVDDDFEEGEVVNEEEEMVDMSQLGVKTRRKRKAGCHQTDRHNRYYWRETLPFHKYRYDCPMCPQVKSYRVNRFVQHLAIHTRRPFKCRECVQFLPNDEEALAKHWNDYHKDNALPADERFIEMKFSPGLIWKCDGCLKGFLTEDERDLHEPECEGFEKLQSKNLVGPEPVTCSHCQKISRNISEWRLHRFMAHPEIDSLSCFYCDNSYGEEVLGTSLVIRNDGTLLEHLAVEHKERDYADSKCFYECQPCAMVYTSYDSPEIRDHAWKVHGIPNDEIFRCEFCPQPIFFKACATLRTHRSRHHFKKKEKQPNVCEACGREFVDNNAFQHHKYTQHKIVPENGTVFTCPIEGCKYESVLKGFLNSHVSKVHFKEDKIFQCDICGKKLKTRRAFKKHTKRHEQKNEKKK